MRRRPPAEVLGPQAAHGADERDPRAQRPEGAPVDDVKLFVDNRRGAIRIKAAGGIKTLAQARALIDAGADRLGASNAVALVIEEAGSQPAAPAGND